MTFMLLIDMDVNRFYTAIPPSHIDLAISWNERLCSSKNRLFIGSIWLYMFMYDIYIYTVYILLIHGYFTSEIIRFMVVMWFADC